MIVMMMLLVLMNRQDLLLVPVIQDIMVQLTGMTHVQVSLHYY